MSTSRLPWRRAEMGAHGERLDAALADLERLLDLLFGYVSPVDVELRATDAERVAESLAAQPGAQGVLAAAVAGRLIDLQGGELRQAGGGCAVTLPVAS